LASVLFISDLHHPWAHPKALLHLQVTREKFKCDKIICLGDEIDAAAFSIKWPMNPDLPSASDELKFAIEKLQPFYKEFPEVDVVESNHGMRMFRKARVTGLPSAVIRRYQEILEFPEGWHFVPDLEIDGVYVSHGESFNKTSWRNAFDKLKQSSVIGHIHSNGGVIYNRNRKKQYFSGNFGCLIDQRHQAFDYGKHILDKPTLGCGVVLDGEEAYFVPMPEKWV
jgi:hypothetical protein